MCFTSGTTGLPKGVVYSHRAIAIHALTAAWLLGINEGDTVLPVVPMFHANAWCFPFTCTLVGAKQVFPGPHLDPQSLLDAFVEEEVTVSAGVPTIWMGILQALDANPTGWDLSRIRTMTVGGAAPPRAMIEAFGERHGLHITHGWGMTEMCPIGTISGAIGQELGLEGAAVYDKRAQQGPPIPFVEIRARGEQGLVPWDGESMGELEVRGPSISSAYYESPDSGDRWTDDGWFKTGDIVTIGSDGYVEIQDRAKDLVKSGGEWISTVALENALMGHPAIVGGGGDRSARREVVGAPARGVRAARGRPRRATTSSASTSRRASPSSGSPTGSSSSRRSRRPRSASSARPPFASSSRPPSQQRASSGDGSLHLDGAARGGRARHDRQPADERPRERAARGARGRDRGARRRRRRPRDRPPGRGRAGLRRRRGHQGVPGAPRVGQRGRLGPRDPARRPPHGRGAHAVRRRDPGVLPRRRPRARDVLRRSRVRRRRAGSASPRSSSG